MDPADAISLAASLAALALSGRPGPEGTRGAPGAAGATGPTGPAGAAGPAGASGATDWGTGFIESPVSPYAVTATDAAIRIPAAVDITLPAATLGRVLRLFVGSGVVTATITSASALRDKLSNNLANPLTLLGGANYYVIGGTGVWYVTGTTATL